MSHRAWRCGILSGLLCICCGFGDRAAAQGEPGDTVLDLHGTVVNGATGRPLARALVVSQDRRLATMTDNDGHFAMAVHLPAQNQSVTSRDFPLMLTAQKPGFTPAGEPYMLSLNSSVDSTAVQLQLMPSGVLTGLVTAEGLNTANGVRVSLLRHAVQNGFYRWQMVNAHATNARGEFRFTGLTPGDYTVVTASWRGPAALPRRMETVQEYPSVFPGDTPAMTSASVLRVHYGETAATELHLHRATFYPVRVPVATDSGRQGLVVRVLGDMSMGAYALSYNEGDGAVEGRLPDGSYTVQLTAFPVGGPGEPAFQQPVHSPPVWNVAIVHLQVAGRPLETAPVALAPLPAVEVHVASQGSGDDPRQQTFAGITLVSEEASSGDFGGQLHSGQTDTLSIENVPPGRYHVEANTSGYVATLTCGGTDLTTEPLVIGPGGLQQPIDLTVGHDGGTVSGAVTGAAGPMRQHTFLVLLPVSGGARFVEGGAGQDGHFTIGNVAPGTYRLFATDRFPSQLPFRDPEALRALRTLGVDLSVAAGEKLTMDAPWVEPRQLTAAEDAAGDETGLVTP